MSENSVPRKFFGKKENRRFQSVSKFDTMKRRREDDDEQPTEADLAGAGATMHLLWPDPLTTEHVEFQSCTHKRSLIRPWETSPVIGTRLAFLTPQFDFFLRQELKDGGVLMMREFTMTYNILNCNCPKNGPDIRFRGHMSLYFEPIPEHVGCTSNVIQWHASRKDKTTGPWWDASTALESSYDKTDNPHYFRIGDHQEKKFLMSDAQAIYIRLINDQICFYHKNNPHFKAQNVIFQISHLRCYNWKFNPLRNWQEKIAQNFLPAFKALQATLILDVLRIIFYFVCDTEPKIHLSWRGLLKRMSK